MLRKVKVLYTLFPEKGSVFRRGLNIRFNIILLRFTGAYSGLDAGDGGVIQSNDLIHMLLVHFLELTMFFFFFFINYCESDKCETVKYRQT